MASDGIRPAGRPDALPRSLKLAYGAPAFAGAAMAILIAVLMPRFYSDVVLAPLGYVAVAIALARAFDALTDPLMGWLSDRTRTRWGRRKPYMVAGGPLAAVAFFALFAPPSSLGPVSASLWFGACFALFFLFATITSIPYAALGAELTVDYRERSSLFGYRSFFVATGTICASLLPAVLGGVLGIADERLVFRLMSGAYALLLLALGCWLLIRVPERPDFARRESNPLVPGVRRAIRNRPFRILLLAGIVNAIPAAIPAILMPYFVEYVLQPDDPTTWVGIFLVVYLGAGLLFVPFWMAVARRIGKLGTLVTASAIGISGSLFYYFAGPGQLLFVGSVYFVTGTVSMAGTFLIPAMAADVIDYDELRTGKRREGQYSGFWTLIPKFVAIPGSSIPLAILAAVGYVPNQAQSADVMFWIRFMYSIFPAAFYLTALVIVSRYPISERIHGVIRRGIEARQAGADAIDPLSGLALPAPMEHPVTEREGWFLDHFSPRELRRSLARGPRSLVASVLGAAALSLGVALGACGVALDGLGDPASRPPLTAVLGVVVAGLAFTAFVFHALRLAPARRMVHDPLAPERLRAHLDALAPGGRHSDGPDGA